MAENRQKGRVGRLYPGLVFNDFFFSLCISYAARAAH